MKRWLVIGLLVLTASTLAGLYYEIAKNSRVLPNRTDAPSYSLPALPSIPADQAGTSARPFVDEGTTHRVWRVRCLDESGEIVSGAVGWVDGVAGEKVTAVGTGELNVGALRPLMIIAPGFVPKKVQSPPEFSDMVTEVRLVRAAQMRGTVRDMANLPISDAIVTLCFGRKTPAPIGESPDDVRVDAGDSWPESVDIESRTYVIHTKTDSLGNWTLPTRPGVVHGVRVAKFGYLSSVDEPVSEVPDDGKMIETRMMRLYATVVSYEVKCPHGRHHDRNQVSVAVSAPPGFAHLGSTRSAEHDRIRDKLRSRVAADRLAHIVVYAKTEGPAQPGRGYPTSATIRTLQGTVRTIVTDLVPLDRLVEAPSGPQAIHDDCPGHGSIIVERRVPKKLYAAGPNPKVTRTRQDPIGVFESEDHYDLMVGDYVIKQSQEALVSEDRVISVRVVKGATTKVDTSSMDNGLARLSWDVAADDGSPSSDYRMRISALSSSRSVLMVGAIVGPTVTMPCEVGDYELQFIGQSGRLEPPRVVSVRSESDNPRLRFPPEK